MTAAPLRGPTGASSFFLLCLCKHSNGNYIWLKHCVDILNRKYVSRLMILALEVYLEVPNGPLFWKKCKRWSSFKSSDTRCPSYALSWVETTHITATIYILYNIIINVSGMGSYFLWIRSDTRCREIDGSSSPRRKLSFLRKNAGWGPPFSESLISAQGQTWGNMGILLYFQ